MQLEVFDSPTAFDALADVWDDLLARSIHDTLFLTHAWQRTWWQVLGDGELRIIAMRDGSSVVGIAPIFFEPHSLGQVNVAFVGCKEVSDYLDFIFLRGCEAECFAALIDFLRSADAPHWDSLSFCNVIEHSPTLSLFAELLRGCGWKVHIAFEDVCPILELPPSFEAYLSMLEGKARRELQRKLRRATEDVAITFANDGARLGQDVDDFIRLMKASTPEKHAFMTPRMERFFHAIARTMFEQGRLQLAFLEVGGARAATYMNFTYKGTTLVYNSGLEPSQYAYLSPGQVLLARLIEKAIADGQRYVDFLQGDEPYKYELGGKDTRLYTLSATR